MQWLAEDLMDTGATFGTELRAGDKPRVIVSDADLGTRIILVRYGLITTWHSHLPLTGRYTSYGLEATPCQT